MAPEMFTSHYDHQVDIFSLGKVMAEMVSKYTKSVPPPNSRWWGLVQQLTQHDPRKRLLAGSVQAAASDAKIVTGLE